VISYHADTYRSDTLPSANELLDLITVHRFYVAIVEGSLGYRILLPQELQRQSYADDNNQDARSAFLRWLGMLDLAISPPMVRDQLNATQHREGAEALLRYYVKKCSVSDLDRDKTDCVLGFLCRHPAGVSSVSPAKLSSDSSGHIEAVREFQLEINRILAGISHGELPAEHEQLLREYEFLYQELIDFRTFDQLIDCGILSRIHDLKKSFGASFYQPSVLSAVGVFNGIFGKCFDDLFLEASRQIKSFAERVQQQGTSIMSQVDGDVRVKHLTELKEEQILDKEYIQAREDFQKVSTFKKAVDKRRGPASGVHGHSSFAAPVASPDSAGAFAPLGAQPAEQTTASFARPHAAAEEYKLRQTAEQIRLFVRAADAKVCFTVPLPMLNLSLSGPEVDAFRSDYGQENSFRARYADAVVNLATTRARIAIELLEFQHKQSSAYRWKPHADSLMYLMNQFERLQGKANDMIAAAKQRGLVEKVDALNSSLAKLHSGLQSATLSLQSLDTSHSNTKQRHQRVPSLL